MLFYVVSALSFLGEKVNNKPTRTWALFQCLSLPYEAAATTVPEPPWTRLDYKTPTAVGGSSDHFSDTACTVLPSIRASYLHCSELLIAGVAAHPGEIFLCVHPAHNQKGNLPSRASSAVSPGALRLTEGLTDTCEISKGCKKTET